MPTPTATGERTRGGNSSFEKSLLDTDIFSEITKAANPTVLGHATAYRKAFSRDTISAVTFMEIIRGHQKKQAFRQLQNFLASTVAEEVIPCDRPAAELARRIAGDWSGSANPSAWPIR